MKAVKHEKVKKISKKVKKLNKITNRKNTNTCLGHTKTVQPLFEVVLENTKASYDISDLLKKVPKVKDFKFRALTFIGPPCGVPPVAFSWDPGIPDPSHLPHGKF